MYQFYNIFYYQIHLIFFNNKYWNIRIRIILLFSVSLITWHKFSSFLIKLIQLKRNILLTTYISNTSRWLYWVKVWFFPKYSNIQKINHHESLFAKSLSVLFNFYFYFFAHVSIFFNIATKIRNIWCSFKIESTCSYQQRIYVFWWQSCIWSEKSCI